MTHTVPTVCSPAPDFTLDRTSGTPVTLSTLRGHQPVLLAFFPLAFTSRCTAEMCALTDDYAALVDRNVRVLPISVDLASDFKREASRAYGTLLEHMFFSTRAYFLTDTDGVVRWAHVEESPRKRRENAEILEAISRL